MTSQAPAAQSSFPCDGCGAHVEFKPGSKSLQCPYCGHKQAIAQAPQQRVREHSYKKLMAKDRPTVAQIGNHHLICQRCGARTDTDALATACQFCTGPLTADAGAGGAVAPEAVVPFKLSRAKARDALRGWVSTRWFAPKALKKVTEAESSQSTYLPHWTFDAKTTSQYRGERGTYYYTTETYTTTENGKSVTRTRQVRKTRWRRADGTVKRAFDDVLVLGTRRIAPDKLAELEPWPLKKAQPYNPAYLAGHAALRYDVEPEQGLTDAKQKMAKKIESDCRRDIGGDDQRVHTVDTSYAKVTYKLMLLPVWICCYIFAGKTWQVLINGVTGEVQGQRPYSVAKIAAVVAAGLAVVAAIVTLYLMYRQ